MRSVQLQKAYDQAEKIDAEIAKNGLPPLIEKGLRRFDFIVSILHEEGTRFLYKNAYCIKYKQWLLVFAEHHDINVISLDEVYDYSLMEQRTIPQVDFEAETLKIVESVEDDEICF
jgi:hypothetical protein